MGKIIAFTGAHGTGKTTSVYDYAGEIKKQGAYEIGIITETARRCPFPIFGKGSQSSVEAQLWIFSEQIRCELDSILNYEITISDRTVVDVIAYSMLAGLPDLARDQIAMARHHVGIYDTIFIKPVSGNGFLREDGIRSTDRQLQIDTERILIDVYRTLNLPLIPVISKQERR